jgi:hypothetical protein
MDIPSIASSVPVSPLATDTLKSSDSKTSDEASSANTYQPPPPPPLPPGQGVRVDQLA